MRIPTHSSLASILILSLFLFFACSPYSEAQQSPVLQSVIKKLESGSDTVRIVCFGDSITGVYYHSGSARAWTDMLGLALKKSYPKAKLEMSNAGISGHTTVNALARIKKDVLDQKPDLVVVMFGMNDVGKVPIADYEKNLRDITQQCQQANAAVMLCSTNSVYDNPRRTAAKLSAYAQRAAKVATDLHIPFVDFYQSWSELQRNDLNSWMLLMSETIHPNLNGHKYFAEQITTTLSGKKLSLDSLQPAIDPLQNTLKLLRAQQAIKLIAMPPYDIEIPRLLKKKFPQAQIEVTSWPVKNQTLAQIRQWSQKIRKMSPTLVAINVPVEALAAGNDAEFIRDYQWILNNSFHFGKRQWDVLAFVPESKKLSPQRLHLTRQIIIGKDLAPRSQLPHEFSARQTTGATDKPNVLLVMTDDQGYGDFSLHGNPLLKTPHLDRFAQDGIQFERFFVSPFCAPTRASLLTGRYSHRTGTWSVTHNKEAMRSSEVTIAEALQANGYRTGCFGKWHNGGHYPRTPIGQGFDEFLGFNHGHINQYFDTVLLRGSTPEPTKGYLTNVLSDEAIRFITKKDEKKRPFFCYLSYNAPHTPTQVPDKWFDLFKNKGLDDKLAAIYGMCANLDENFGRLIAALEKSNLRDNTIIIFLTDNGANTERFNSGMRGHKVSVHEGGSRVPLFIQWPARLQQKHTVRQLTAHIDLYPTILELCGATAPDGPPIDGRSLVPLLQNPDAQWDSRLLFTNTNMGNEARPFPGAARSDRYRLVHARKSKAWQLFDMKTDPGENHDLAEKLPKKTNELLAAYTQWWDDVSPSSFQRMPLPVGYAEQNPVELNAVESYPQGLQFHHGPGFSHDWLTGWENTQVKTEWDLDVVQSGKYEVEVHYLCPRSDAGAKIGIRSGQSVVYGTTTGGDTSHIPLPNRDKDENKKIIKRHWNVMQAGTMKLEKGRQRLSVFAETMPGQAVMELKSVFLKRK